MTDSINQQPSPVLATAPETSNAQSPVTNAAGPSTISNAPSASGNVGTQTPTSNAMPEPVAAHPHHHLVKGVVTILESLTRQLETSVGIECQASIEYMHTAITLLKGKLETAFKKAE